MSLNPFGFIGAGGNISRAILSGILQKDYIKPKDIYIYDLFPEKCEYATKSGVTLCKDEAETAKGCRYLFLCVKPQQMDIVLERISPVLRENHCLVSIAAGITTEKTSDVFSWKNAKNKKKHQGDSRHAKYAVAAWLRRFGFVPERCGNRRGIFRGL